MKYLGVAAIVSLFSLFSRLTSAQECAANGACDTHERCSAWKEEGECLRNAAYMKEFCPASCIDVERSNKNGECRDLHPRCSLWADLGECEDNELEMNKYCPKACEMCPEDLAAARSKDEEGCEDKHSTCLYWSNKGECESNKRWMSTECAKSCGTCEKLKPRRSRMIKQQNSEENDALVMTEEFGVRQKAEGTQNEETIAVIEKSIEYMNGETMAALREEVRDNCMNRNALCAFWAAIGECTANKAFMQTNCAPSCLTCHLIDIEARCPPLVDAEPALRPGDLNKMFERIVRDAPGNRTLTKTEKKELLESGMSEYSVMVHSQPSKLPATETDLVLDKSLPPWVITFENFLTPEECQALIDLGHEYKYERSEDVGEMKFDGTHDGVQSERRTSENAWCSNFSGCRQKETPTLIHDRMSKVMGIPANNSEDFQLLRYEVGQFYRTHHDFIPHQLDRQCGPRILTFFLYLSDAGGGGTNFPQLDMTIEPKQGRALLWPSVYDSDPLKKDPRLYHQALEVKEGTKFAANGWIHMHDYVTVQTEGCN